MPEDAATIVVLGAGVTGLTAAWKLAAAGAPVVLLEKEPIVGGLGATFTRGGFAFDLGSHRLHEGYDPEVAALVRDLCGGDLLSRERRGVIYLGAQTLPYPPSSLDLMLGSGIADCSRFVRDFVRARLRRLFARTADDDFEAFIVNRVGRSLYERFYEPYAVKLYGMAPARIAPDPAVSRMRKFSVSSVGRELKAKVLRRRPRFLYPARGIGQMARALQDRFTDSGGTLRFVKRIDGLAVRGRAVECVRFTTSDGRPAAVRPRWVVSTLPLGALHDLVAPADEGADRAPFDLRWRDLRILYLITRDKIPDDHETYYFPCSDVLFGRVSEVGKYSPLLNRDGGRAALTIEIPCSHGDDVWEMTDERLAAVCVDQLRRVGLLRPTASAGEAEFFSKRLRNVYPVYEKGWRERFDLVFGRLNRLENLYMIGRGALFLHCNLDHCMAMALKLARHLEAAPRDKGEWDRGQREFFDYRVRE
jgi:protoporphyrinogen oxidase